MALRTAHGRARDLGRLIVSETTPSDELPPATGSDPARVGRDAAGRFASGNPWARLARAKAGPGGALASLDAQATPEWRAARRWAQRAAAHRVRELAQFHGGDLSSGVCMLVVDASDLRADARYIAARARADGNPELSRIAASLLASARQAERDAWEIAAREAEARLRTHDPADIHRAAAEAFGAPSLLPNPLKNTKKVP